MGPCLPSVDWGELLLDMPLCWWVLAMWRWLNMFTLFLWCPMAAPPMLAPATPRFVCVPSLLSWPSSCSCMPVYAFFFDAARFW